MNGRPNAGPCGGEFRALRVLASLHVVAPGIRLDLVSGLPRCGLERGRTTTELLIRAIGHQPSLDCACTMVHFLRTNVRSGHEGCSRRPERMR